MQMVSERVVFDLPRKCWAEFVGTALLLAVIVGSGIMAHRLSGGNTAIALLGNTIATGGGLFALIAMMGAISGAHFNPIVSVSSAWQSRLPWDHVLPYVAAQVAGAVVGVWLTHCMFDLSVLQTAQTARAGTGQFLSEVVASFCLIGVIFYSERTAPARTPYAVAAFVMAGYWFTASTGFANPAVTIARSLSDTFAGIRPVDTPAFIGAQILGMVLATLLLRYMWREK